VKTGSPNASQLSSISKGRVLVDLSGDHSLERARKKRGRTFRIGEIEYIFTVDNLMKGIEIPKINQVCDA